MDTTDSTDIHLPLPDLHNVIALDYHYADQRLYYTDLYLDVIRSVDSQSIGSRHGLIVFLLVTSLVPLYLS